MDNAENSKNQAGTSNSGNNLIVTIAALVIIIILAIAGYYWYHNIYSRGHYINTATINKTIANQTQTSSITTTTQQSSKPMNVSGSNGIFNSVSGTQQKPPTPPSSVG